MNKIKLKVHPVSASPLAFSIIFASLILGVIAVTWFADKKSVVFKNLNINDYQRYSCTIPDSGYGKPVLKILTFLVGADAKALAHSLCDQPDIRKHLGGVEVTWQIPSQIDLLSLDEQQFDLIFYRVSIIEKLPQYGLQNYRMIAELPSYVSLLISHDSKPELTNDYFRGKVLGLIDDPLSSAGYGVPMTALAQADIDVNSYKIRYFGSKNDLESALSQGDVDLIASYSPSPLAHNPHFNTLVLGSPLPGPAWYIRAELVGTPIHCSLLNALNKLSLSFSPDILPSAQIIQRCPAGAP